MLFEILELDRRPEFLVVDESEGDRKFNNSHWILTQSGRTG